jgi:hypothetical protein
MLKQSGDLLFPPLAARQQGTLTVDDVHTTYWEESGAERYPAAVPEWRSRRRAELNRAAILRPRRLIGSPTCTSVVLDVRRHWAPFNASDLDSQD